MFLAGQRKFLWHFANVSFSFVQKSGGLKVPPFPHFFSSRKERGRMSLKAFKEFFSSLEKGRERIWCNRQKKEGPISGHKRSLRWLPLFSRKKGGKSAHRRQVGEQKHTLFSLVLSQCCPSILFSTNVEGGKEDDMGWPLKTILWNCSDIFLRFCAIWSGAKA